MAKTCETPLKANPFQTYRDPVTGQWIILKGLSGDRPKTPSDRSTMKG